MMNSIIFILVICSALIVGGTLVWNLEHIDKISNFFKKIFGSKISETNNKKSSPIFEGIKKQARSDAENDNFHIRYENSLEEQEYYNDCYKARRKELIKHAAFYDAEQIFLYNYGESGYKPFLRGAHFTIPAEIAEYQGLFIEEKSRLEEQLKAEHVRINELKDHLKAIYADEHQNPIDPKDFNKVFQLGEDIEQITIPKRSVSAQDIINKNPRTVNYNPDYIAVKSASRDARDFKAYSNTFKGQRAVDYHITYYNMRMKIVEKSVQETVKEDIENYDQFKNHLLYRKEVRKDKSTLIPSYKDFKLNFNEKQYYTKKYREIMKSLINDRDISVEVPVYETVDRESA